MEAVPLPHSGFSCCREEGPVQEETALEGGAASGGMKVSGGAGAGPVGFGRAPQEPAWGGGLGVPL